MPSFVETFNEEKNLFAVYVGPFLSEDDILNNIDIIKKLSESNQGEVEIMEALGLNFVDWTIIVVITASVVLSITRGFVKEFLSLFIWVIAFFAAVNFEFLATPKINEFIGNPDISKIISYVVVFIIALFLGGLIIKFLSGLIKWSGASGFDKLLGVLFGFTRGFFDFICNFFTITSKCKIK